MREHRSETGDGGVEIAFGKHDDKSRCGRQCQPGIGRRRDEIEVNTHGTGHNDILTSRIVPEGDRGTAVLHALASCRRFRQTKFLEPDQSWLVHEPPTQPTFWSQLAQRMWLGLGSSNGIDARNNRRECISGRQGAMHHGERFAVVATNPDLDPSHALIIEKHTGDFESTDLAPDAAMLDHDINAGIVQQRRRLAGGSRRLDRNMGFSDSRRRERAPLDFPHRGGISEELSASGDNRGVDGIVDHQVKGLLPVTT